MKIERLKKNHKKQVIIGAVVICVVGGALTFNLTKAKYKLTESIPLVRGTVNYKVPDLRTVALYTNNNGTYQETNDIPTSGYTLNKEKSVCKVYDGTTSVENAPVDPNIKINYHDGVIGVDNIIKRNTRCYLYFDKKHSITIEDIIESFGTAGGNTSFLKIGTPDFASVATGEEKTTNNGVYTVEDGMYGGTSYYWRGAATTNHVIFANKCWRIVRINGDNSIRLIYNGTPSSGTCTGNGTNVNAVIMGTTDDERKYSINRNKTYYVGWTYKEDKQRPEKGDIAIDSNAKIQTEKWYNENIGNNSAYDSKVADGKFCNNRNAANGYSWSATPSSYFNYSGNRILETNSPTLSCYEGDIYTLKVGAITIDEVEFAGGNKKSNTSYYMCIGQPYWTMTPNTWNTMSMVYVYLVSSNGIIDTYDGHVDCTTRGLRPVINLKPNTQFNLGGNGTQSNPYIVQ